MAGAWARVLTVPHLQCPPGSQRKDKQWEAWVGCYIPPSVTSPLPPEELTFLGSHQLGQDSLSHGSPQCPLWWLHCHFQSHRDEHCFGITTAASQGSGFPQLLDPTSLGPPVLPHLGRNACVSAGGVSQLALPSGWCRPRCSASRIPSTQPR